MIPALPFKVDSTYPMSLGSFSSGTVVLGESGGYPGRVQCCFALYVGCYVQAVTRQWAFTYGTTCGTTTSKVC